MAQNNNLVSDVASKEKGSTAAVPNALKITPVIQVFGTSSMQESFSVHELSISRDGSFRLINNEV